VLGKGIVEDLTLLRKMQSEFLRGEIGLDREGLLRFAVELQELFRRVGRDGPVLAVRLNEFANRQWLGIFP